MLKPKTKTFLTVINWWTKLRQVKISFEFHYQEHQLNYKKNNIDTINREFELQNTIWKTESWADPEEYGRFVPLTTCALLASIGEARLDPTHPGISWKFNPGLFCTNWVNKCRISSVNSSFREVISLACFCFRLLISSSFFKEHVVTDLP